MKKMFCVINYFWEVNVINQWYRYKENAARGITVRLYNQAGSITTDRRTNAAKTVFKDLLLYL